MNALVPTSKFWMSLPEVIEIEYLVGLRDGEAITQGCPRGEPLKRLQQAQSATNISKALLQNILRSRLPPQVASTTAHRKKNGRGEVNALDVFAAAFPSPYPSPLCSRRRVSRDIIHPLPTPWANAHETLRSTCDCGVLRGRGVYHVNAKCRAVTCGHASSGNGAAAYARFHSG